MASPAIIMADLPANLVRRSQGQKGLTVAFNILLGTPLYVGIAQRFIPA